MRRTLCTWVALVAVLGCSSETSSSKSTAESGDDTSRASKSEAATAQHSGAVHELKAGWVGKTVRLWGFVAPGTIGERGFQLEGRGKVVAVKLATAAPTWLKPGTELVATGTLAATPGDNGIELQATALTDCAESERACLMFH